MTMTCIENPTETFLITDSRNPKSPVDEDGFKIRHVAIEALLPFYIPDFKSRTFRRSERRPTTDRFTKNQALLHQMISYS